jgi:ribosomal protein S18 acetylase RimI-like enzyme
MGIEVRAYASSDETEIVDLWRACSLVVPWNDPHEDIARKLQVQPELFLVACAAGRIVGSVMAGYEGHRGWLNYLAVAPRCRRQGIGRRLVREAEARLRAMGCPKINLQVRASNTDVVEFYRKLGFVVDDVLSMGKRLEAEESPAL